MRDFLQHMAMKAVDRVMAGIPQPVPNQIALRNCKIISHRGEHDNISAIENTLPAFDNARANGVWGIEFDIRWTADLVPVIIHDPCPVANDCLAIPPGSVSFPLPTSGRKYHRSRPWQSW